MFLLNGKVIQPGTSFTDANGVQYPPQWLYQTTLEEKQAIGIIEVPDPVRADDRFYWDGNINNPKDLDGLKKHFIAEIKDTAGKLLANTDWYVIRKVERSIDVPSEVALKRTQIVTESNRLEIDIQTSTTVEELITVLNSQNWS
jgi:hypothetical protein